MVRGGVLFLVVGTASLCAMTACDETTGDGSSCRDFEVPDDATASLSLGNAFGSVATITCDDGFGLVGSPTYTCSADDATWHGGPASCRPDVFVDVAAQRTWQSVGATNLSYPEALAYCDALVLDGHDDYRIPTVREFASLGGPERVEIPSEDFPTEMPSAVFWTSTEISPQILPLVFARIGFWGYGMETNSVLCVRGAPLADPSLSVQPGDVVVDASTGLTWQRVADTSIHRSFVDAGAYCASLGGGFRIPTVREVLSIVDFTTTPSFDQATFVIPSGEMLWTTTPRDSDRIAIGTSNGDSFRSVVTAEELVLCVK